MIDGEQGFSAAVDSFREDGHRLIDRMADYLGTVGELPVSTSRTPGEIREGFDEPLPRKGRHGEAVWNEVWDRVVSESIHLAHPMYMGHQVAPPLPQAVLADALAGLLNNSLAVWEMSPTGTMVEGQVIQWMTELLGFPPEGDGTFVSGGSAANLTGLLAAREAAFPGSWARGTAPAGLSPVVLSTTQAHYSLERALGVMGLPAESAVALEERDGRMDPRALARRIDELRTQGRHPFAIVATAASTSTGRFDDLDAIADVARDASIWLHVDGAHGASFLACPALRSNLHGIQRADSVAWDPHKMMFMPISTGAILVRNRRHLDSAFQQSAPYLFHLRPGEQRSIDIGKRTLQCSKRFDALKLWVSLKYYGLDHFGALQEKTVENTRALHRMICQSNDFEAMHSPESNILCFRHLPTWAGGSDREMDELQGRLRDRYNQSGRGWITATSLDGRRVLRVTLMNPNTESVHLNMLLDTLREQAEDLRKGG
ncbi:pyridoxal-dependent decarboxylase [soil metagenome]